MTRFVLTVALGLLTLALGLWTAVIVTYNHQRAENLSRLQRKLEILRAANDQAEALASTHVWGQATGSELPQAASPAAPSAPYGEEGYTP